MKSIVDRIVKHYSDTDYERSEKKLENEKWLVKEVAFNRYFLMPAAVLIQVCCGSLYAWSGFNLPIEHYINSDATAVSDRGQALISFYLAVASFGITAATFIIIHAFLADQFGSGNVEATHGVILTSWYVVGGLVFNEEKLKSINGYNMDFHWILAFVLLGLIICVIVPADLIDRKLPKILKWSHCPILKPFKFVMLSEAEEMAEWDAYVEKLNLSHVDQKNTSAGSTVVMRESNVQL